MALSKESLAGKIKKLFDLEQNPKASDEGNCADLICNYIDEYLSDVELDPFPGPGVTAPPASVPDPNPDMASKTSPAATLTSTLFRAALKTAMAGKSGDFSLCGAELVKDLVKLVGVEDSNGYAAAGASVCTTPPNINAAFAKGHAGESHTNVANELANQIHNAVTSTTFTATAPYAKAEGGFIQTPPAPLYSSSLK